MAELGESSSSSTLHSEPTSMKSVFVRVKRKADQERVDAFWLEINDRPTKRTLVDFEGLTVSDSSGKAVKEVKPKRLLLQHVETTRSFKAAGDVLQSYLDPDSNGPKDLKTKSVERRSIQKQDKKKELLKATARQKHEDLVRSARFEQIWKSRREKEELVDDALREICHLYDVVQLDATDENNRKPRKQEHISIEDNAILCNYLPLLREYISPAAEQIESEMRSYASGTEPANDSMNCGRSTGTGYVYDLYTVEDDTKGVGDEDTTYPLVQVIEEEDYYDGPSGSDYATDDSNAEDNPLNDYPDEESSADENEKDLDPFDEDDADGSQYGHEVVDSSEDEEEDWRWRRR